MLTTGMGEAASDYLVHQINPVAAVGLGAAAFVAALALQFSARRYVTWIYWLAAAMVAVFGTMAADVAHVALGVPYLVSTAGFLAALIAIFALWRASEGTLSIHSVRTRRREVFYWATVMATFALGTAAGDMTAATLGLGYLGSGIMFAMVITVPAIAYRWLRLDGVAAFWLAYIVTRPLGASFADWLDMPRAYGGMGIGRGPVAAASAAALAALVAYLTLTGKDGPSRAAGRPDVPGLTRQPLPGPGSLERARAKIRPAAAPKGGRHRAAPPRGGQARPEPVAATRNSRPRQAIAQSAWSRGDQRERAARPDPDDDTPGSRAESGGARW